jgi:hypothetical protein
MEAGDLFCTRDEWLDLKHLILYIYSIIYFLKKDILRKIF